MKIFRIFVSVEADCCMDVPAENPESAIQLARNLPIGIHYQGASQADCGQISSPKITILSAAIETVKSPG